ncbi:hypothetical protein B0H65DRAFT_255402 [Neurospora tetraspora]|uniref:Uncharacterized protein n=1 Tax=Neurospora tetraspora TaxID=94610 RepID=A0AAE0JAJ2_9PEZI|nr:hypothetical protein B0H65DRAFT_255402 [Neurospora tetraspora]
MMGRTGPSCVEILLHLWASRSSCLALHGLQIVLPLKNNGGFGLGSVTGQNLPSPKTCAVRLFKASRCEQEKHPKPTATLRVGSYICLQTVAIDCAISAAQTDIILSSPELQVKTPIIPIGRPEDAPKTV